MGAEEVQLISSVEALYEQYHHDFISLSTNNKSPLSSIDIDQLALQALRDIHRGNLDLVPKELWQITNDTLQHAVAEVFGLEYKPNPELVQKLRTNTSVFAAFKAHRQANLIRSLLLDQKGNQRDWNNYYPLAKKVSDQWNKHWLKTEYNTATARARTAYQFDQFNQAKDLYPNLEWIRSRSSNPREAHLQLVGIIKPLNDPFWNRNFPGNIWNCKCSIRQTSSEPTEPKPRTAPKPAKGLDQNPVKGELFTASHPFFDKVSQEIAKKIEKIGLIEIRKQEQLLSKQWAAKNIDAEKGLIIKSNNLQTGQINYRRGNVKDITAHNLDPVIKAYTRWLPQDVKNWQYIGWGEVKPGKHLETIVFAYYRRVIDHKERFINVKLHKKNGETPYAIMNYINLKEIKRGNIPKTYLDMIKR